MKTNVVLAGVGSVAFLAFAGASGAFGTSDAHASDRGEALQKKFPTPKDGACGVGFPMRDEDPVCLGSTVWCGACCCPSDFSRCAGTTCVRKDADDKPPEKIEPK